MSAADDLVDLHRRWHSIYSDTATPAQIQAHHQITHNLRKAGAPLDCDLHTVVEVYRSTVLIADTIGKPDLPDAVVDALMEISTGGSTHADVIGYLTATGYEMRVAEVDSDKTVTVTKARSFDAENAVIARNRRRKAARTPHPFVAAKWATRDGRVRCVTCGASEQGSDGMCKGMRRQVAKMIREEDGEYCVYDKTGTRSFGCYPTMEEATDRLGQIESFSKAERVRVGDFVSWNSAGGRARGRIEHVMTEGVFGIPDSDFSVRAEPGDPAVAIRVWERGPEGWRETETVVGHKASTLTTIGDLRKADTHTPPQGVQEAAQRAVEWIREGRAGDNFTAVGRARASQLARGDGVSTDTVRRMASYFARHEVDRQAEGFNGGEDGYPSPGRVAWDAWGGDAGRTWATTIMERLTKSDPGVGAVHVDGIMPQQRRRKYPIPFQDALVGPLMMDDDEEEEDDEYGEPDLSPRQMYMMETYELARDLFGPWTQGTDPDGAHYIPAASNVFAKDGLACATCIFYDNGACEIVDGMVEPLGLCKLWVIPEVTVEPVEAAIGPHTYRKPKEGAGCAHCGQDTDNWRHQVTKMVMQKEDDRRFTLGPMYIPDTMDAHGEWTDADELQEAVWDYVRSGDRRIRLQHKRDIVAGEWVECMAWPFPVTVPMTTADGKTQPVMYPANTVFLGVVWEPWAWELVLAGKLSGYSIGGHAERVLADLPMDKHLGDQHNQASHGAKKFKGPDDSKAFLESHYGAWKSGLTDKQDSALRFYHSPGYTLMNGQLRGTPVDAPPADLKRAKQATKDLTEAIDQAPPLAEGIMVHRGMSADQFDLTPGSTFTDKGFVSTSLFKEGAGSFNAQGDQVQARIFLPAGTKAAAGSIKELTLPPSTTFRVVARKGNTVDLEVVLPEGAAKAVESVVKHPGHPDQKVHGRGKGRRAGVPDRVRIPGMAEGDELVKGRDSMWEHVVSDGQGGYDLSPERKALHEKLVAEALAGVPVSKDPTFVMMGGGGGSGKGAIQKNPAGRAAVEAQGQRLPRKGEAVIVDADEIKSDLPEFEEYKKLDRKNDSAAYLHEESSYIGKQMIDRGIAGQHDVVLDGTGDSDPESLQGKITKAEQAGYKVQGTYATVPTTQAMARNIRRAEDDPDRGLVPAKHLDKAHVAVSEIVPEMADRFDSFTLWETTGGTPTLLATASRGRGLTVRNEAGYTRFLRKADSDRPSVAELDAMRDLPRDQIDAIADGAQPG